MVLDLTENWWDSTTPEFAISALVHQLKARRGPRLEIEKRFARLYSNRFFLGMQSWNYFRLAPHAQGLDEDRLRLNAIAAVIDTITSKLAVEQPRVVCLLNGADFQVRAKSKDLQSFIDAVLESSGAYTELLKAFRDAEIFGTGIVRLQEEFGQIKAERIYKHEIVIDEQEAFYGKIGQLFQCRTLARYKLLELYPKKAKLVAASGFQAPDSGTQKLPETADLVSVTEAWYKPADPETPGRHVVCTDAGILEDEEWNKQDFPFVFLHWKEPIFGFWGDGIVEDLQSLQIEINRLLISVQKAMRAASNPMIFIPAGSAISKMHISDEIGAIIPYVGKEPTIRVHQTVHPEILQQIEYLYRKCFETTGVSQLSASGVKPAGVTAQVAMRELQNIETERFSVVQRSYSKAFVECAKKMIGIVRDLYETHQEVVVKLKGKEFLDSIDWAKIDLTEDQFELSLDTANKLPLTRAGRISALTEWLQAGIIQPDEWREAMDMPDLNEEAKLRNAPQEFIREVVNEILYKGNLIPPENHDNLTFAYKYSIMAYQKAKLEHYPDDRVELLSQYISLIEAKMDEAAQQAAPPPAPPILPGPQGPGQAPPMAPPVSPELSQLPPITPSGGQGV